MTPMKLSITIQTPEVTKIFPVALLSGAIEEKLRKAARFGAEGVELVTTNPSSVDVDRLLDLIHQNHLQVAAVASGGMGFAAGLTLLNPDPAIASLAQQRLAELIRFAACLEAPVITVGSFRGRAAGDRDAGLQRLAAILRTAGDMAVEQGVRLALEPLNRYEADLLNNSAQGLAFLQELDHPAVGLLLDTYHVNIEETSWTEPFRRVMAAGKLFHVHLGDNNRLPPGKGLIDFGAIVRTLQEIGYAGWLSAELLPQPDPDAAAEQTLAHMRKILEEMA